MKDQLFSELVESVREGGSILRGKATPSSQASRGSMGCCAAKANRVTVERSPSNAVDERQLVSSATCGVSLRR